MGELIGQNYLKKSAFLLLFCFVGALGFFAKEIWHYKFDVGSGHLSGISKLGDKILIKLSVKGGLQHRILNQSYFGYYRLGIQYKKLESSIYLKNNDWTIIKTNQHNDTDSASTEFSFSISCHDIIMTAEDISQIKAHDFNQEALEQFSTTAYLGPSMFIVFPADKVSVSLGNKVIEMCLTELNLKPEIDTLQSDSK